MLNTKLKLPPASIFQLLLALACLLVIFLHFILSSNIPLMLVTLIGGIILVAEIAVKMLRGDFGADLLAAIALITAGYMGQWLAAVLIVLMLSGGQALENYARRKASSVLLALAGRMPAIAHRKLNDHIEDININSIIPGDQIVIYPHETSPVDGVVVSGHGAMDESYLTGEPYRVSKAPGASVLSGAINGDSLITIRADKLPQDSRYSKIMEVMQDAVQKRPSLRRLGDQIGAIFAPIALIVAVAAWYLSGDSLRFLAVLVVATPCPLLIAIPITVISAISIAAKQGIIIKDPVVLERLPTCRTAIFDKTGTLTYGQASLSEILTAPGFEEEKVLQYAASLERYSKHPLAQALLKAAATQKIFLPEADEVSELPGLGLLGLVKGKRIKITHRKKIIQADLLAQLPELSPGLECIILVDENYAATFRFRDRPREEGKSFIDHLGPSHKFNKIMLVSGDRESEVNYLATLLGIKTTLASQSPEQKLAIVREETAKAPTLFMGDGINDAPALSAATVGLAFGQHSSVTAEAAGCVIMDNTLMRVDELIHLSYAMRRIALQSAVGGMGLSLVGMGFAAAGMLSPVMGALLQEVIDIVVIINALKLIWSSDIKSDLN